MNGQNRWLYLIKRMVYRFFDDGIPQSAAELSYFLLFSMFPLLMFVNSMLAQLDLSSRECSRCWNAAEKSAAAHRRLYSALTGTPSVQSDDRRSGSDAVFSVPCGALNDAHGQRYLPR